MDSMEKLVRRAQRGDKAAFVEWIETRKLSLSRAALAILHNEEDAADAVAETVATAFAKLCTLREPKYAGTWLTRILIYNSYEILRQRQRSIPVEELPEDGVDDQARRDRVLDIRRSLDALAENDRLLLTLYYLDDLSVREIAGVLGIKENTVKTRLMRSRNRFKRIYEEQEEFSYEASGK